MLNTKPPILGFSGDYHWLSNFSTVRVQYDGVPYLSVENAYVAAKTLDIQKRKYLEHAKPGQAKRYGRALELRPDWDLVRVPTMVSLLRQKYSQEPYRSLLIATEGSYIEETNTWGDTFWGVCNGVGKNTLGTLIMQIRDELI